MSNVLSSLASIDLDNDTGTHFIDLLEKKLARGSIGDQMEILNLIPYLPALEQLLQPCLQLLTQLISPSQFDYDYSYEYNPSPQGPISILMAPLLFAIEHLMYPDDSGTIINEVIPKDTYFAISSYLKSDDYELQMGSITLLVHYSLDSTLSESAKWVNIQKMLPVLIDLIDMDNEKRYNPFMLLSQLCLHFDKVNDFLMDCNIITKFTNLIETYDMNSSLDKLSDLMMILSSVTSNNEANRKAIINNKMVGIMESIFINYDKNLQLTISTCYLLRSLSRSVANLRTYLNEMVIIPQLIHILKSSGSRQMNLLKSVILSIIANLCLDFSPLRKKIISKSFFELLSTLMRQGDTQMTVNSLFVIRHIIYNENDISIRHQLLDVVSVDDLMGYCTGEELSIQEQALNVIRNLTCHKKELNMVLETEGFWTFVEQKLDLQNKGILECVIYIIVNISATDESHRDMIMSHGGILSRLHDIMNTTDESIIIASIWVIINLGWLDNVQRTGESSGVIRSDDSVMHRIQKLKAMGFVEQLKGVVERFDSLEIKERGKVALSNLEH
jgi:hypothetical protein